MKKKYKRVLWVFMELDYKAMESYLEEMAMKGWMLKKMNKVFATFEMISPKKIHFTVDIFEKAGALMREEKEDAGKYRSLYEETGWSFIDSKRQLQFFCSEAEERPPSIRTNLETEKRMVSSSLWKRQVGGNLYTLLLFSGFIFFLYPIGIESFQSNTSLAIVAVLPVFLISTLINLVYLFVWRYRMKKSVKKGEVISTPDYRKARTKAWMLNGLPVILALLVLIALLMDFTSGSSPRFMVLFTTAMIFLISHVVSIVKEGKSDKKSHRLLYLGLGVVSILFVMVIYFPDQEGDHSQLPDDYPRIEGEEWEDIEGLGGMNPAYLHHESFLLPVSYEAYNFGEIAFTYAYHQAVHQRIAAFIFQDILEDLRRPGHQLNDSQQGIKELASDHQLYEHWEVDRIAYDEHRSSLLLLKGETVLNFRGRIDFYDPDFIRAVNHTFF